MNKLLVKKLDTAFAKFIRTRDDKGSFFVCCSCSELKPTQQMDAGHWVGRRYLATRWREDNVHGQCRSCNRFNSGNGAGYTLFMINKYGKEHVEYLEGISRQTMKYTDFDGEVLLKDFKKRTIELLKTRGL